MNERSLFRSFAILLLFGWLILFVLLPNLAIFTISFLSRSESDFVALPLTVESYAKLFDPVYVTMFGHSLKMAIEATAACLLLGYPFAWFMSRARPCYRPFLLLLVIIPFWTNSLIRAYAIRSIITVKGVLNSILLGLGLIDEPLRLLYTEGAVIMGLVYILLPFMVLPLYSSMEKLDRRLIDAAADLGAGRFSVFTRIIFPLTLPGVIAGSLLVFLPALGMFYVADLLGGARDLLIGNFIKNQFLNARDWPFGAAAAVVLFLFIALFPGLRRGSVKVAGKGGLS